MRLSIRRIASEVRDRLLQERLISLGDYLTAARDEIRLLAQVENQKGIETLDDIPEAEGIDGVFIGRPDDPAVKTAVLESIRKMMDSGKAAVIPTSDEALQRQCYEIGARFIATEIDPRYSQRTFAPPHRLLARGFTMRTGGLKRQWSLGK